MTSPTNAWIVIFKQIYNPVKHWQGSVRCTITVYCLRSTQVQKIFCCREQQYLVDISIICLQELFLTGSQTEFTLQFFFGVFCTVTNFQCQKLVVQQLFPWSGHPMEFRYFCIINRWNWFQLSFSPELNGIGYLSAHYCSSVWQMVVYIAQLCWCVVSCGCDKIWSLLNINCYS